MVTKSKANWIKRVDEQPDLFDDYKKLFDELQRKFQTVQSEAYASWCAWEQEAEEQDGPVMQEVIAARHPKEGLLGRVVKRLRVEPWTAPTVAIASPKSPSQIVHRLGAPLNDLKTLHLQPYLRLNVHKEETGAKVTFLLEPATEPERPALFLEPLPGIIAVRLFRPKSKQPLTVQLGGGADAFLDIAEMAVRDYEEGEEKEWEVEFDIQPGKSH